MMPRSWTGILVRTYRSVINIVVENYPPPKKIVTTRQLDDITRKLMSASTAASTAARHDFDAQRAHVAYLELQDPKYPGHSES